MIDNRKILSELELVKVHNISKKHGEILENLKI